MTKPTTWTANRELYLLETSRPGVFAAGDVRSGSVNRVASEAVSEGLCRVPCEHRSEVLCPIRCSQSTLRGAHRCLPRQALSRRRGVDGRPVRACILEGNRKPNARTLEEARELASVRFTGDPETSREVQFLAASFT